MVCEYYCLSWGKCRKGLTVTGLYRGMICKRKPEKCPVLYFSPGRLAECH